MSLIKNNARVAADIAVALESIDDDIELKFENETRTCSNAEVPLVIGGSILDVHYRAYDKDLKVSSKHFK
jgi:hypothetical protein